MMNMSFWFGDTINDLLFPGLNISSVSGLILACVLTFIFAIIYESAKYVFAFVKFHSTILKQPHRRQCFSDDVVLIDGTSPTLKNWICWTSLGVGLHSLESVFGYVIMLLVMTYNGYFILSLLLATGLCYFFFGQQTMALKMKSSKLKIPCEHCIQHQKESVTSSTEVITDNMDSGDNASCSHTMSEVAVHYSS